LRLAPPPDRAPPVEAVELPEVTVNRRLLVGRKRLTGKPVPAAPIKQVGVRAARDQMGVKDSRAPRSYPGAVPDELIPPRHEPAQTLRLGIRRPHLGQEAGRVQARQNARRRSCRLHVRVRDRLSTRWRSCVCSRPLWLVWSSPPAILIPVTNAIEALNAKLRRAVKSRGHFPNDEAATKLIYLVLRQMAPEWKMSPREWGEAKTQFAIMEDRFVLA
jgi:Transposase, Mutator family